MLKRLLGKLAASVRNPRSGPLSAYRAETGRSMSAHRAQVAENYAGRTNPFAYYERLLDGLLDTENLTILPLCEMTEGSPAGTRVFGLRHDVDADPEMALRAARALARRGMAGSFYLLHTAPYYGEFHGEVFVRNPLLPEWVRALIVAGCEIGLHNDALGVYQTHGRDGIAALRTEIAWLRSLGAVIRGTVAHNSAPAYGAENYEIFRGRGLWRREVPGPGGRPLPLGAVSEKRLGLAYEGTFAVPREDLDPAAAAAFCADAAAANVRSRGWMQRYLLDNPYCRWDVDVQFWLVGPDVWVIAGRVGRQTLWEWEVPLARVLERVAGLPKGTRSVMLLHPVYVRGA